MTTSVFQTFFTIGAACGLSILVTAVIPAMYIYKKFFK